MASTTIKDDVRVAAPEKEAAQVAFAKKAEALKAANTSKSHRTQTDDGAEAPLTGDTAPQHRHDAVSVLGARAPPSPRLLNKRQVLELTNKTFPTIWSWMRRGAFPPARDVCGRPMWIESEVNAWIESLPVRRYKNAGE